MSTLSPDAARALRKAHWAAERDLREALLPELQVLTDEDGDTVLVCPGCGAHLGAESIRSVDVSERWTDAHEFSAAERYVRFYYDGYSDYEGLCYETGCCDLPVDLPDEWEERTEW